MNGWKRPIGFIIFCGCILLLTSYFSHVENLKAQKEDELSKQIQSLIQIQRKDVVLNNEIPKYRLDDVITYSQELKSNENCVDRLKLSDKFPKPDFIVLGATKSGSTSIFQYLNEHPNIKRRNVDKKEPSFFSEFGIASPVEYQQLFVNINPPIWEMEEGTTIEKNTKLGGDFSTSYLAHPLAPRRIAREIPNVKLILVLRNPIDRAYSHYIMKLREGLETKSFENVIAHELEEVDILRYYFRKCYNNLECTPKLCYPPNKFYRHAAPPKYLSSSFSPTDINSTLRINTVTDLKLYMQTSYLFRGIYDDQVDRYLQLFDQKNIFLVKSEEFYDSPQRLMEEITSFLHLPYFNYSEIVQSTWGGGASNPFPPQSYAPLDPETRTLLSEFFSPYNHRLYSLLNRDLGWD